MGWVLHRQVRVFEAVSAGKAGWIQPPGLLGDELLDGAMGSKKVSNDERFSVPNPASLFRGTRSVVATRQRVDVLCPDQGGFDLIAGIRVSSKLCAQLPAMGLMAPKVMSVRASRRKALIRSAHPAGFMFWPYARDDGPEVWGFQIGTSDDLQTIAQEHTVKLQLAGALLIALAAGCAPTTQTAPTQAKIGVDGNVKYGTFARENIAKLDPPTPITELYVAGDSVFGYTKDNTVYSLSGALEVRYIQRLAKDDVTLRRPIAYGEDTIFPTTLAIKVVDKGGNILRTLRLPNPLTSDVRLDQRGLLLAGTAAPTGGRVSVIDPQLTVRPVVGDTLIGSVYSAPVGFQGIIYAAADDGNVYAIGPDNRNAWPLSDMRFATNRAVKADLVIDEYGLFVASSDTKLYALDRATGRIKWRFMAEVPLVQTPMVTSDRVYQVVDGKGLVAIDKINGKLYRDALWTAEGVTQVLATDDNFVYGVEGGNKLVALGKDDGKVKFDLTGDFTMFAADASGRIFAATPSGTIASFVRRPYTGQNMADAK